MNPPRTSTEPVSGPALVALADDDPCRTIAVAEAIVAADSPEPVEVYRALGLAYRPAGNPDASKQWLERGLREAERCGDTNEQAELLITYSATKAMLGDFDAALQFLTQAEEIGDNAARLHALVQRAGMLARRGDVPEALRIYRDAERELRLSGDDEWLGRLLNNRGLLRTYTGDLANAEADLRAGLDIGTSLGLTLASAERRHNLGFVLTHRGDLLEALGLYEEAAADLEALNIPRPEIFIDRCEALMYAGLTDDALAIAAEALEDLTRRGMLEEAAEGLLQYARAADAAGCPAAGPIADRAQIALTSVGNQTLADAAAVISLRSKSLGPGATEQLLADITIVADHLDQRDRRLAGVSAWLLGSRVALAAEDLKTSDEYLARAERRLNRAGSGTVPMSIGVQMALTAGLLAEARGETTEAATFARRGLAEVETIASQVGLSGQQAYVRGNALELIRLQIRLSLRRAGNTRLFRWIETGRTSFDRSPQLRRADDEAAAAELERLRWVHTERTADPLDVELAAAQATAEQRVRGTIRRAAEQAPVRAQAPTLVALRSALDESSGYVSWFSPDDSLWELKADHRASRRRLVAPASVVRDLGDRLSLTIGGLATQRPAGDAHVSDAGQALQTILLPDGTPERLVLNPPADLFNLAWTALPALSRRSVVVTPSAAAYVRDRLPVEGEPKVLVVAGPALKRAPAESRIVANHYSEVSYLRPSAATNRRVLKGLATSRVAHFACHAIFRPDNPSFSYLRLHDGPLFLHDIELLRSGPETVVLSACSAARSGSAGNQLHGFVTALLRAGARTVIAPISPVPDTDETLTLVDRLHRGLESGLPPGLALCRARSYDDALATYTSHAFQCFGWG